MSFNKRQGTNAVCYTKPLESLKCWNDHFFWIDAFACPALFSWHTGKSVSRDVISKSFKYSLEYYATLVAYPAPFHKYPRPFLCLVVMSQIDLLSFIRTVDPTKMRIYERQCDEDEPKLLDTTVGCVFPLLPVAPDHSSGDLKASVDKLFDEGEVRQKKRKTKVADAGEPSHPAKKLREDYGAPGRPTVGGKSQSSIQRLLVGAVQNAKVRGGIMPTLPFVSSSVSTTSEREDGDHTELLARANLHAIGAPTSMSIITSATTTTPTADPAAISKEKLVVPLYLVLILLPQAEVILFLIVQMVDEFAPPKCFASIRKMDHDQLFTEFNVGAAHQISLSVEVRMRAEYHIKEKRRLKAVTFHIFRSFPTSLNS
uniref:Transposase (Putative), gypsy type n=1 Tax=Tanacetum cinerariifolium TaxID=118510 RepID=A0A699K3B2_TANCI|nr:hypothetical protein [Tanacetum cinerariifolium]